MILLVVIVKLSTALRKALELVETCVLNLSRNTTHNLTALDVAYAPDRKESRRLASDRDLSHSTYDIQQNLQPATPNHSKRYRTR